MGATQWHDPPAGTRLTLLLWTAVLLAPIAWAAHLTASYAVATLNCDGSALSIHVTTVLALALALAGGVLGWRIHQRLEGGPGVDPARLERRRFMAGGAVILSMLFGFTILVQAMPAFLLRPCE